MRPYALHHQSLSIIIITSRQPLSVSPYISSNIIVSIHSCSLLLSDNHPSSITNQCLITNHPSSSSRIVEFTCIIGITLPIVKIIQSYSIHYEYSVIISNHTFFVVNHQSTFLSSLIPHQQHNPYIITHQHYHCYRLHHQQSSQIIIIINDQLCPPPSSITTINYYQAFVIIIISHTS